MTYLRCTHPKPQSGDPNWFPWPDKASLCGIHTKRFGGALGHIYYMNELAGIIRQVLEMANLLVCPHIHHLHEDSGRHLKHAWQAEAWRDLDPDLVMPMVQVEMTSLLSPIVASHVTHHPLQNPKISLEFLSSQMMLDYIPGFTQALSTTIRTVSKSLLKVTKQCFKEMEQTQLLPLHPQLDFPENTFIVKMLDAIVEQLDGCQKDGVWAWDIDAKAMVKPIPSVLAMLGDSPMQNAGSDRSAGGGKQCQCEETLGQMRDRANHFLHKHKLHF
ncbi:hypothetical protein J3R30DRAFT_3684391 [Lentinula aciculospora]|uniref:Uncharacterized protein n=1 Tax=Lentinula aciculospora TaxID=153920 RepID=A0A9W9A6Y4_9AGAR|nr:hypothetical protein J3R30DRAFT_3684391 [Lentinula aciculospora]